MRDFECKVWCPKCKTVKYEVWKEQVKENVFQNVRIPEPKDAKNCECGSVLERQ